MINKIIFVWLFSFGLCTLHAQPQIDTVPPYKKDNRMPDFKILQMNNNWVSRDQLPKRDYTVIVYFSPDCGHCQHEVKEMIKKMDQLSKVNLVWASYKSVEEIREFYLKYQMNKYSNMYVGREPTYKLPSFYRVKFTPFVAVYDKKGLFIKAYEGGVEMNDLLLLLKLN